MTFSVTLRILAMGVRFGFLILIARQAPVRVVAEYGVLAGLVASIAYFVGFDLYIQTARNVGRRRIFNAHLSNQIIWSAAALTIAGMVAGWWSSTSLPSASLAAFMAVLATDYLLQEVTRVFLGVGRYNAANLTQFARIGLWPGVILVGMLFFGVVVQGTEVILRYWVAANVIATLAAVAAVSVSLQGFRFAPSLRLFRAGLRRQALIFSSSLVLLLFAGLDRVLLSTSAESGYVAAYVLFGSLYGAVLTIIYSGLVNPFFSGLADKSVPLEEKRRVLRRFGLAAIGVAVVALASLRVAVTSLLDWLGREEYIGMGYLQSYFIAFVLISVLGLIPHFALFARRRDRSIALAALAATVVFFVSWLLLKRAGIADAMPITLCLSAAVLGTAKATILRRDHAAG